MTSEYHKQYYLDNKDTLLPKIREYGKNKYDNNLEYKLLKRYQSRIDNHFGTSKRIKQKIYYLVLKNSLNHG